MSMVLDRSLTPEKIERLSTPAFKTFLTITALWKLKNDEKRVLLGSLPESTFYDWKQKIDNHQTVKLSRDTLERISYLLNIYESLNILLPSEEAADGWIKKSNKAPFFSGRSALDRMLSGNVCDLKDVSDYLFAQRGW